MQDSFPTLVTALLARGDDELTLVFVKQALLDEEQRQGKSSSGSGGADSKGSDSALKTGQKYSRRRRSGACLHCEQKRHFIRNCPELKKDNPKHRAKTAEETQEDSDADSMPVTKLNWFRVIELLIVPEYIPLKSHVSASSRIDYPIVIFGICLQPHSSNKKLTSSCALGAGKVKVLSQLVHGRKITGWMTDVLYVPKLTSNLFSVHAAALKGNVISFGHKYCWIRNKRRKLIGTGSPLGKLYKLNCVAQKFSAEKAKVAEEGNKTDLWYQRLAHMNVKQIHQLVDNSTGIELPPNEKQSFCEACVKGKMHRLPHHPLKEIKSTERLQLVYTDVCGPMQTLSRGGSRYFITFTDDYSRYCKTYFLKKKSEALAKFQEFKEAAENETGLKIKGLRADRGGEYLSEEFECYLRENGIRSEFTAAYSPQQNGVAERLNRILVEAARSMLNHAGLTYSFWTEAIATTTYLRNRMVTTARKSGKTPYQLWHGEKPN